MRASDRIRLDIARAAKAIELYEQRLPMLRKRMGELLVEARDHPELTLEEGRKIPEKEIPRQTANRLINAVDSVAYDRSKADPHDQAHGLDR